VFICDICYAKAYCGGNTCPLLHPLKHPFPFHKKASVCFKYQIAFDHHVHMKQTWSVVKLKTTTFTWRDLKCSETKNHHVHMKQTWSVLKLKISGVAPLLTIAFSLFADLNRFKYIYFICIRISLFLFDYDIMVDFDLYLVSLLCYHYPFHIIILWFLSYLFFYLINLMSV